jgi:hypothetical protein
MAHRKKNLGHHCLYLPYTIPNIYILFFFNKSSCNVRITIILSENNQSPSSFYCPWSINITQKNFRYYNKYRYFIGWKKYYKRKNWQKFIPRSTSPTSSYDINIFYYALHFTILSQTNHFKLWWRFHIYVLTYHFFFFLVHEKTPT